jgi:HK97 family phage portal protein
MGRLRDRLKRFAAVDPELIKRVEPLEGTRMSLWNSVIPSFWQDTYGTPWLGDATLAERVWVSNRCQQLNAQQIASMPLQFHGADEPAWVSAPDPEWYPNGIGDALHAIVTQLYAYGFCCLYITDRYASGFPRTWTVLPSNSVQIKMVDGARAYKLGETPLNPSRVVQIDRNPGTGVKGTSALAAYAQQAWGLLAAGNQSLAVSDGGIPQTVLKPQQRVTKEQADTIQADWAEAAASRGSKPAIIPPNLEFEVLSFNPHDMALLETQEWNSRVIATAYGVPAVILNMSLQGGLTYQNPAALGEMWWRFELRPTATRIANAFTAQMLPRGQWVSLDASDTFEPIITPEDDEQGSQVAKASPAQQPLTVIGGTG